jgi:hypothetical protein
MAATSIDIPLPANIEEFLKKPKCLQLPKPGKAEINLPTGGKIKGIADITKGIPDDCSLIFSLALQLGPFLASIECLVKLMGLIQPLIDVVKALGPPDPPKLITAVPKFLDAAEKAMPCVLNLTGAGFPLFVKDLLCLIIKLLNCMVGQLKGIVSVLGGIALQIKAAEAAGNSELLATLQCAQENAQTSAQHVVAAIDPVMFLLSLAEPFLGIAGVDPIKTPALASPEDLQGLQSAIDTLDELVKTLKLAAEPLGGC